MLNDKGIIDKITKKLGKRCDYVSNFKYTKNETTGKWRQDVFYDSDPDCIDTPLYTNYIDSFSTDILEELYNDILSLVNIGNIMKQINESKILNYKQKEEYNKQRKAQLIKLYGLLDMLYNKGVLDKIVDKLNENPRINYRFKYSKDETTGEWCRIVFYGPNEEKQMNVLISTEYSIDHLKTEYNEIIDLVDIVSVMKQINK